MKDATTCRPLLRAAVFAALLLALGAGSAVGQGSDSVVKASAKASKPDDNGNPQIYHKLVHGTTLHGKQLFEPLSTEPLTYYHRTGPIGQVIAEHLPRPARVASSRALRS